MKQNIITALYKTFTVCMALCVLTTALPISGLASDLPSDEVGAQLSNSELVSSLNSRSGSSVYTILEIVPTKYSGSIGYYIPGQEPWMDGLEVLTTAQLRKDYMDAINELDDLAAAGVLGPLSPSAATEYSELLPWDDAVSPQHFEIDLKDAYGAARQETVAVNGTFTLDTGAGNFVRYIPGMPIYSAALEESADADTQPEGETPKVESPAGEIEGDLPKNPPQTSTPSGGITPDTATSPGGITADTISYGGVMSAVQSMSAEPTPEPAPEPTPEPTPEPAPEPTPEPAPEPTPEPETDGDLPASSNILANGSIMGPQQSPSLRWEPVTLILTGDYLYVGDGNGDYVFTPDAAAPQSTVIYGSVYALLPYINNNWFRSDVLGDSSDDFIEKFPIEVISRTPSEVTATDVATANVVVLSAGYSMNTADHLIADYSAANDITSSIANSIYNRVNSFASMPILMDMRLLQGNDSVNLKSVISRVTSRFGTAGSSNGFANKNVFAYNQNYVTADYDSLLNDTIYDLPSPMTMAEATEDAIRYVNSSATIITEIKFGNYGQPEKNYIYLPTHPTTDGSNDLILGADDVVFWVNNTYPIGYMRVDFYYQNPSGDYIYDYDEVTRKGVIKPNDGTASADQRYSYISQEDLDIPMLDGEPKTPFDPAPGEGVEVRQDYTFTMPSQVIDRFADQDLFEVRLVMQVTEHLAGGATIGTTNDNIDVRKLPLLELG